MTISFSGLASGLDTSTWVASLVKLRQAKVTTLETKKESVALSQSTLSTIKSYFSAFRTAVERLTDSKFNIPTMDLYAQNVATSSNNSKLSASVDYTAENRTYNVQIERLASNTQAKSSYYTTATIMETATDESRLSSLGLNEGVISVNVNGVERGMSIRKSDTISTLINKFKAIGVDADYNDNTGIFSVNVSVGDINDTGATGIIDKLHLTGVNEGYESGNLQYVETVQNVANAVLSTKLKDLGEGIDFGGGSKTVKVENASGEVITFAVNGNTTLGGFIDNLKDAGLYASLSEEGILEITGGRIIDGGTFDAVGVFGLSEEPFSAMVTGSLLTETVIVPDMVDLQTRLVEDLSINRGFYEVTNPDGNIFYLSIYSGQTMSDLIADLGHVGIEADLDASTGVLTLRGGSYRTLTDDEVEYLCSTGSIQGVESNEQRGTNMLSLLGLDIQTNRKVLSTKSRSSALSYSTTVYAYNDGVIRDFATDMYRATELYVHEQTGEIVGTVTVNPTDTFSQLFAKLSPYGIDGDVHDGVVMFSSDDHRYLTGEDESISGNYDLLRAIGMSTEYTTIITTFGTISTSGTITYNTTQTISDTSTIHDFVTMANEIVIRTQTGADYTYNTVTISDTDTFSSLNTKLQAYGVTCSVTSTGTVTLKPANSNITVSGTFKDSLDKPYHTTLTTKATATSLVKDYFMLSTGMYIKDKDGNVQATVTISGSDTFADLFGELAAKGVDGDIHDGKVTFIHNDGGYVDGNLTYGLGVTTTYYETIITHTFGTTSTGNVMTYNTTEIASDTSVINDFVSIGNSGKNLVIKDHDGVAQGTVLVTKTMTFADLFEALTPYGVDGDIHDGSLTFIHNDGGYVDGDFINIDSFSITTTYTTITTVKTVGTTTTSDKQKYSITEVATEASKIKNFVSLGSGKTLVVKDHDGNAQTTIVVSGEMTFTDLFAALTPYGVDGDIDNGRVSFIHNEGGYVDGTFATALGVTTQYTTVTTVKTVGTSKTGSAQSYISINTASTESVINDFLTINNTNNKLVVKDHDGIAKGTITITNTMKFGELFAQLAPLGMDGDIDDGQLIFTDRYGGYVDGSFAAAMGVTTEYTTITTVRTVGTTTTSGQQKYTITEVATEASKIKDFVSLGSGKNLVIKDHDGNAQTTIVVSGEMTFADLFASLTPYGVDGDIDNGRVSFIHNEGGYVSGSFATALGVTTTTTTITTVKTVGTSTTSNAYNYVTLDIANDESVINDFLTITDSNNKLVVKDHDGNATGTVTITNTMKFGELFAALVPMGIHGDISDGQLTFIHNYGGYVDGSFATAMGITTTYTTVTTVRTVGSSTTGGPQSYSTVLVAGADSVINDYVTITNSNNKLYVKDVDGRVTGTVTVTNTMKYSELFAALAPMGVHGDINDGQVTFTHNNGGYVDGSFVDSLGVTTTYETVTTAKTIGTSTTGGIQNYSTVIVAGADSVINDFVTITSSNKKLVVKDVDGNATATVTLSKTMTYRDLFAALAPLGVHGDISDGQVTFTHNNGGYVDGSFATALGITTTYTTVTTVKTVGSTTTGSVQNYSTVLVANADSVINDFVTITNSNKKLVVKDVDGNATGTVTVTNTMKYSELFAALAPLGVHGDINDGQVTFTHNYGGYVDGSFVNSLGVTTTYQTVTTVKTIGSTTTGGIQNYSTVLVAGADSVINDFVAITNSNNLLIVKDVDGNVTGAVTVTNTMKFGELFAALAPLGVHGDINDGQATFTHNYGGYVDGSFVNSLGVTTTYQTVTTVKTVGSSTTGGPQSYSTVRAATAEDVINDFLTINNSNNKLVVKDFDGNATGTVIVTNTMKFGELFASLAGLGVNGDIHDGQVTFVHNNGGYVDGSFVSALGAVTTYETVTTITTMGSELYTSPWTYNHEVVANDASVINDFIAINNSNNQLIIKDQNGNDTNTIIVTDTMKFSDLFAQLARHGVNGDIHDGQVTFVHYSGGYVDGSFVNALGITTTYETFTTVTTSGELLFGDPLSYTTQQAATSSDVINDFVQITNANNMFYVKDAQGNTTNWFVVSDTMTFDDLFDIVSAYGVTGSIHDGRVTFVHNNGGYVDGSFVNSLGITTSYETVTYTRTIGVYNFSDTMRFTVQEVATDGSVINDFLTITGENNQLVVKDYDGNATGTVTITNTMKFVDLFASLAQMGVDGDLHDGRLVFVHNNGGYVDGTFATAMGLNTAYETVTTVNTVGVDITGVYGRYAAYGCMNMDTKFDDSVHILDDDSTPFSWRESSQLVIDCSSTDDLDIIIDIPPSMTVEQLFAKLAEYGIDADLNNGVMSFQSDAGYYIKGDFATKMGIGTYTYIQTFQGTATSEVSLTDTITIEKSVTVNVTTTGSQTITVLSTVTTNISQTLTVTSMTTMTVNETYTTVVQTVTNSLQEHTTTTISTVDAITTTTVTMTGHTVFQCAIDRIDTSNLIDLGTITVTSSMANLSVGTYKISDAQGLKNLSQICQYTKMAEGTTIVLANDIDMSGQSLGKGIGGASGSGSQGQFKGTFDGNGYVIRNLSMTGSMQNDGNIGLFNALTSGHTVKNLGMENIVVDGYGNTSWTGGLVGRLQGGTVDNCYIVNGSVHSSKTGPNAYSGIGGIVGSVWDGIIQNCHFTGVVDGSHISTGGGIAGYLHNDGDGVTVRACYSDTTLIDPEDYAGGIAGRGETGCYVDDCAALTHTLASSQTGAILGSSSNVTVTNCNTPYDTFVATHLQGFVPGDATVTGSSFTNGTLNCTYTQGTVTVTTTTATYTETIQTTTTQTQTISTSSTITVEVTGLSTINVQSTQTITSTSTVSIETTGVTTVNINATCTVSANQTITIDVTTTRTVTANDTSYACFYIIDNAHITSDTHFSDFFLTPYGSNGGVATVHSNGTDYTITMDGENTVGDFLNALSGYGIGAYINEGQIHLNCSEGSYVKSISDSISWNIGLWFSDEEYYTTSTVTAVHGTTTAGAQQTRDITKTMTSATTFRELGILTAAMPYARINSNGTDYNIYVDNNNTVGDFMLQLSRYGFGVHISDGMLTIVGNENCYIKSLSGGLENLNLDNFLETNETYNTTTITEIRGTNGISDRYTKTVSMPMTTSTTFGQLGIFDSDTASAVVNSYGVNHTIIVTTSNTVGDFLNILSGYGLPGYVDSNNVSGRVVLDTSPNAYLVELSGGLEALHLETDWYSTNYSSTTTISAVHGTNTASDRCATIIASNIDANATFGQLLGYGSGSAQIQYLGEEYTININQNNTIGEFITALTAYGISAYVQDGVLHIQGSQDGCVLSMDGLLEDLNFSGDGYTTSTIISVHGTTAASGRYEDNVTTNMNSNTTFAQIGKAAGTATINFNGTDYTVSMDTHNTLGDFISAVAAYGISGTISSDGRLTLTGSSSGYLKGLTGGLAELGLTQNNYTTSTITAVHGTNTAADRESKTITTAMTSDTTFAQIGKAAGTATINFNGTDYTVSMGTHNTVGDFISAVAAYGVSGTISSDGKLTLTGSNLGYLKGLTGGLAELGLTQNNYTSSTITAVHGTNTAATRESKTVTTAMTSETTFAQIGKAAGTATINFNGTDYTVSMGTHNTVGDFISAVAAYGVSGTISNDGKLTLTGSNLGYLKGLTGGLAELGLTQNNYTSSTITAVHGTNTAATRESKTITTAMTSETTFAQLGKAAGTAVINFNGTDYTISMGTHNTVGDFISAVAAYGVSGTISSDGRLTLSGSNLGYLKTLTGGLAELGLTQNSYTSSTITAVHGTNSAAVYESKTVTVTMTSDTTFAQLGKAAGTATINFNGTDYTVSVGTHNTVGDFISAVAAYGISGTISADGKLTLTGSNLGYLKGLTGGLAGLGLTQNNYTTSTITAVEGTNTAADRKVRDITIAMNSTATFEQLGIAAGSATVNYNGNDYTVSMGTHNTIGDFISALAAYGIQGTISSDGRLTLTGSQNSYIKEVTGGIADMNIHASYTTGTITTVEGTNSMGTQKTRSVTITMTSDTTFAQIGKDAGTATINFLGTDYTVSMGTHNTIGDFISAVAAYGIQGTISADGKLTLQGSQSAYVSGVTGGIADMSIAPSYTTSTISVVEGTNSAGARKTRSITVSMTSDTTFAQLGKAASTVVVNFLGNDYTVSMGTHNTVGDFISAIAAYGIQGTISADGKLTLTGSQDAYVKSVTGGLADMGQTSSYSISTIQTVEGTNSMGTQKTRSITITMTSDTTFAQINKNAGSVTINFLGNDYTVSMGTHNTIGDFISAVAAYGIQGTISSDGKLTLTGSQDAYIKGVTGGIADMNINVSYTTNTITTVEGTNSASCQQKRSITNTMVDETTVGQVTNTQTVITVGSTPTTVYGEGTVSINYHGVDYTVSVHGTTTLDSLAAQLAAYGIQASVTDGKLTCTGSEVAYVNGATGSAAALGIQQARSTRTTTIIPASNTVGTVQEREITNKMTSDTTFGELGLGTNGSKTTKVIYNGSTYTITATKATTLGDYLTALAGYGVSGFINDEGVLTLQGTSDGWIKSIDSGIITRLNQSTVFTSTTTTVNGTNGVSNQLDMVTTESTTTSRKSVKMTNLQDKDGNDLGITTGSYYIYQDGVRTTHEITEDTSLNDFMAEIAEYGLVADIAEDGAIAVSGKKNSYMETSALTSNNSNVIDVLFANWDFTNVYNSNNLDIPTPVVQSITRETSLSNIAQAASTDEGGFQEGLVTIMKNGVKTHLYVNSNDTVGTFLDEIAMYGFDSVINDKGQIIIRNTGDSQIIQYTGDSQASNILDIIGAQDEKWVITKTYESDAQNVITYEDKYRDATEETTLAELARMNQTDLLGNTISSDLTSSFADTLNGKLEVVVDGQSNYINISKNETIGSILDKFRSMGLEATISGGKITVHSGYKELSIVTPDSGGSGIVTNNLLKFNNDIGGFTASNEKVISTTYEDKILAAAGWAQGDTKLSSIGVTTGTLSVYKDGKRARVEITAGETFNSLQAKIQATLSDVTIDFEDGHVKFSSATGKVTAGASTDTSNFTSVTAIKADEDGTVKSTKEVFAVDHTSKVMTHGIFRNGDVTAGVFTVGTLEIEINENTTIDDIIAAINADPLKSGASAYWDEFEGNLVIKSKTAGNSFVNIEAGSENTKHVLGGSPATTVLPSKNATNFTDILGLTKNTTFETVVGKDSNTYTIEKTQSLNTETQTVGGNARITIDGVVYTSNSNTIKSDVTRIEGLTLDLKEATEGETVTITVEKDKETLANAVEDVVNCYNELMIGVDEAIAAGGDLADQTTLKMIRNQLRSYMTSASLSSTYYRNFDAIGISVSEAVGSNISTKTSDVVTLNFNRETFYQKYSENNLAVKALMIGDTSNKGVLLRIEDLIESALQGVSGYFDTQNAAYNNQISNLNKQISKANQEVAKYKEMLESKFSSMDMLIAQMQEQYSSFLKS